MSHWFSENFYLQSKLAQLQESGATEFTTVAQVKSAILNAGMTVKEHFDQYHSTELTSPNPDFNTVEYINAKLATLDDSWTFESLQKAMIDACGSVYDHYIDFGAYETSAAGGHGINPGNNFDSELYLQEKVADLNKDGGNWTVDKLVDLLQELHLTPLDHFIQFGKDEGLHEFAVPEAEQVSDHVPGDGVVVDLTPGAQVVDGTVNDDVFNGVSSSLSADRTLDQGDLIDGKDGNDTLNVNLDSSFGGFKDGDKAGMSNVENIVLNNEGNIQRSFDASGIKGAETYVLNGEINLKDLEEAGVTVELNGEQKDTSIGFTDAAVKGEEDSLNLELNGVGHMEDDKIDSTSITANGIEEMNVTVKGDDYVNLKGDALKSMTLQGDGNVDLGKVEDTVKSFDSSALSGNVTVDLTEVEGLSSLIMGAGDDTITASESTFTPTAVIDGGEGNNTLNIGDGGTVQPTLKNFQNVNLTKLTNNLTVSGKNISDLNTLTLEEKALAGHTLTVANLETPEFTLVEEGAQAGAVTMTNESALTVNTVATDETIKAKTTNDEDKAAANITASHATDLTVNVGEYTHQSGTITAGEAQSVTLNVASGLDQTGKIEQTGFSGTINAGKAETVTVNAEGNLGGTISAAKATDAHIIADSGAEISLGLNAAQTVTIDANEQNFTLATNSNLESVEQLTVDTEKTFDALTNPVNLEHISQLTVSGLGDKAAAKFANLGSAEIENSITVDASGLASNLALGTINTNGGNVTLNFADLMGEATVDAIGGDAHAHVGNVDIIGSDLKGMTLDNISTVANASVEIDANAGDFTVGAVTVAKEDGNLTGSINIDLAGTVANTTLGDLTAADVTVDAGEYLTALDMSGKTITADDLTFTGSALEDNTVEATITDSVDFTGGLGVDKLTVTSVDNGVASKASSLEVNFSGDGGDDTLTIKDVDVDGTAVTGTMNGGDGANHLHISGSIDLSGATISNFDDFILDSASSIIATAKADTITGSTGADTITGGKGADILTGGEGADTFVFAAGDSGTPSDSVFDTIKDWGTGSNKIDFGATDLAQGTKADDAVAGTAKLTAGVAEFHANDDTLSEHITAVASAIADGAAGTSATWAEGSDSYIFISDGTAGVDANDVLIKVVGTAATALTITDGDITALA